MNISEETFISNLGTHIRQLREKKGLSQQALADDCDITRNQIGRIERAEINTGIKTLIRISNALDIDLKELLDFPLK
ncbi:MULTISPECIES: helix-turn-helix domain-containing protein [unclassified Flavobacterium]|jgi:transcriptional regulator with XRE-family HTH domain|uniref:helix-turn-helix domain-containing protein n=1 Tax=unclassified Flavobacterium TaxID=196869 RepID=UPI0010657347|nr:MULTISPECIES: helix-turn-helix transcriptional regulator [unclassified Flavobacterium]MDQ1163904.1 transcriptional regulator with XRE-family HTH domain [Flavobacterium sp. SORGH_AS_0622]TDX13825.1 helix-turn-helix protein [Flavobacterium sp. S87F.05.LMB.W.Kidney.N]